MRRLHAGAPDIAKASDPLEIFAVGMRESKQRWQVHLLPHLPSGYGEQPQFPVQAGEWCVEGTWAWMNPASVLFRMHSERLLIICNDIVVNQR